MLEDAWGNDLHTKYHIHRGDVELHEVIGGGHYGQVYRGTYLLAPVAIKTIRKDKTDQSDFDSVIDEAKVLIEMKTHPK